MFDIFEMVCLVIFIIVCVLTVIVTGLIIRWEILDNTWVDRKKWIRKTSKWYLLIGVIEVIAFYGIKMAYLYIKSMFC